MSTNAEKKSVVIVGAGASGIAAATRLYENGIKDIVVLEAEDRIGGRVYTVDLGKDGILEMGAHWIHGEKDNVVFELALAHNRTNSSTTMDNNITYVRSCGEIVDQKLSNKMNKIYEKLSDIDPEEVPQNFKNLGEFYIDILETELNKTANADISEDIRAEFIENCHQTTNSLDASESWFDTSMSTLWEYKTCEGNPVGVWNGTGYRILFDILMEKSQKLSRETFKRDVILKQTEVERISLNGNGSSMSVECANGKLFVADHVIMTVSIGVLRESHTKMFEKFPLPDLKIRSINNIEFGTVDKIYVVFQERWWPSNIQAFDLLWTKADREEFIKQVGVLIQGLKWAVDIFAIVPVDFAPNVLCAWITGESARIAERLEEKFVFNTTMQVMRKFFSHKWQIPDAVRVIRSNWYTNKHFRGSYSVRSIRTEAANVSSSVLAIPVTNANGIPILLFAGEATSAHYYSTVHGAVESGWREADRLIPFFKKIS